MTDGALLSINAVAKRLGCSPWFVSKLVREGQIESYKLGSLRRFSEAQVRDYCERQAQGEQAAREAEQVHIRRLMRRVAGGRQR